MGVTPMSTTRGVRILVGSALASSVILLGGCASSGTVKSGASGDSNALTGGLTSSHSSSADTSSSSSSDDSSSSSSSSDDSSSSSGGLTGGTGDAGCQAAESDVANGSQALGGAASNPAGALAAIKGIGVKLHADAGKSSGAAASAINKVGDDYINLAQQAGAGKMPDTTSMMNDVTAMATACGG